MNDDVLIVGGGPAGASLAILLGRAGLRVRLFEKSAGPRHKPCGEGIMPAGVAVLQRLGLPARGVPFVGVRYHCGRHLASGRFPSLPGLPAAGLGERRIDLDERLLALARASPGVVVHRGTRVTHALVDRGSVVGVRADRSCFRAALTVAADGHGSSLSRQLGLDGARGRHRGQRIGVRLHFQLDRDHEPWVDVRLGRGYELYVTPLPERELLVAALTRAPAREIAQRMREWIRSWPWLHASIGTREPSCPAMGRVVRDSTRCLPPPGLVLLGDAAGTQDPVTGGGIAQALVSAELLASRVPEILHGGGPAAAAFDRDRGRLLRDARWLTRAAVLLAGSPVSARLTVRALRRWPGLFSHLLAVAGSAKPIF